tara:strand:- start:27382 stop:27912 length:531 start_codon:yes stop_codon:yes gene_type:complete
MKDVTAIKTQTIEHQHDSLIHFYETYPKLVAHKVILKLGESLLGTRPPTLADFEANRPQPNAVVRNIVLRIDRKEFPKLWQLYQGLPYGSKKTVIVNILNTYAQMAEADKRIMESAFWGKSDDELVEKAPASSESENEPTGGLEQEAHVSIEEIELTEPMEPEGDSDPLLALSTGL